MALTTSRSISLSGQSIINGITVETYNASVRVKREQPVHKVCKVLRALRVKREQPVHKVLRAFRVFRVFKVQRGMVLMLKIPETPTNLQSGIYRIIR